MLWVLKTNIIPWTHDINMLSCQLMFLGSLYCKQYGPGCSHGVTACNLHLGLHCLTKYSFMFQQELDMSVNDQGRISECCNQNGSPKHTASEHTVPLV